jgi:membrane protease YdiL (CAAX protease family)
MPSDPTTAPTARPADGRVPRWGMGDAAAGWFLAILGGQISATLVMVLSGHQDDSFDDLPLGLVALAQVGMWAGFLLVPWFASQLKGRGVVDDFGVRATGWDALTGGLVGIASQLILIPLLYAPVVLLDWLDSDELSESARELTDRATNAFDVTMLVLIVVIAAPIFEELFYRGLVLRSIEKRFGTWPAVLGSGTLFGVSHFNAPLSMPGLVAFGIVLGLLVVRTGRLGPAMAAHVAFNTVTVIVLLLE